MNNQRRKVLSLLQQHNEGVNSYDLTFIHGIKQAPTRIKELRNIGYNIVSNQNPNRSVTYILLAKLHEPPAVPTIRAGSMGPKQPEATPIEELIRVDHPNGLVTWESPEYFKQKGLV